MTIFVIGAGFTGMQLAKMLVLERNKVVLIDNDAEILLQQVELMRSEVIEIASTRNLRMQSPRQVIGFGKIDVSWRTREPHLHIDDFPYHAIVDEFFHPFEIGQVTAIISDETRNARLFAHPVDARAVFITGSKGFLHVNGFSRLHAHDGIGGVA